MKTPHAILIGLALIAAAIFFREPSVKPAHAALGGVDGFVCDNSTFTCAILDGDFIYISSASADLGNKRNWKTGERQIIKGRLVK